jgi:hypothetical protein
LLEAPCGPFQASYAPPAGANKAMPLILRGIRDSVGGDHWATILVYTQLNDGVIAHGVATRGAVVAMSSVVKQGPLPQVFAQVSDYDSWRKEQFGRAFVEAVASVSGCQVECTRIDNDSVDLTLMRRTTTTAVRSPKLDVQLKTTALDVVKNGHIAFPLSMKNYDELRPTNLSVPRILVVVLVPQDVHEWTAHSEAELALRRCSYWLSLRGEPDVPNATTKSVHIPRAQVFNPHSLHGIFSRLEQWNLP